MCLAVELPLLVNPDLAAQRALDRLAKAGFDTLSETDKILAAVWLFEAGVGNDGFIGYFSSGRGDLAYYAPTALRSIGATQLAAIATEANAIFGPDGAPRDRSSRRELVRALPASACEALVALDNRYFNCDEDADDLLEGFLAGTKKSE